MKLKLITFSNNLCTIGKMYDEQNNLICSTIEKPWLDNKVCVSCIPAGVYTISPVVSPRFGATYQVCDVKGRTHILFHKANCESQLLGCIAPVSYFGTLDPGKGVGKEWAGLASGKAYKKFMAILDGGDHELTIERY